MTYIELQNNDDATLLESALQGTCLLFELDGQEFVVLQDNTVITRDDDNISDPIFPY